MKIDEAIKELKIEYLGDSEKMKQAKDVAVKALEELQAHREAWKTVLDDMMNVSIPGQDAEYVYEEIYDIINKYRPKEGDNDD